MVDYRSGLIEDEGLRLSMYTCTQGKHTIGVGHNLDANGISHKVAMLILDEDIEAAIAGAKTVIAKFDGLPDNVKEVLVHMVFQMGTAGVANFVNMLRAVEIGAYDTAAMEMLDSKWARQTPARAFRASEKMKGT